jgi:hypothetical protein
MFRLMKPFFGKEYEKKRIRSKEKKETNKVEWRVRSCVFLRLLTEDGNFILCEIAATTLKLV